MPFDILNAILLNSSKIDRTGRERERQILYFIISHLSSENNDLFREVITRA